MSTITATTHDATFGVVSVTKRTSRPYSHAVIRVSDAGDVSASFHMTREAADKAGGRPAPGVTRHVVPVEKRDQPGCESCGHEQRLHCDYIGRCTTPCGCPGFASQETRDCVANRNTSQKEESK